MGTDSREHHHDCPVECSDDLSELLCVTFRVTFRVDADTHVVAVDCLGPCPPTKPRPPATV